MATVLQNVKSWLMMHSIVTLQYANGHRLIIFRQHVWYLCSGIHLKQVLLPIYILKASFVPIYCQRRMASLFSLHIKKKCLEWGWQGLRRVRKAWRKEKKWYDRRWGEDGWGPLFPSNKWLTKFIPHSCPYWKTNFDCGCPLKCSEEERSSEEGAGGVSERQETLHLLSSMGEITRYACNEWEKWVSWKSGGGLAPE